MKKILFAGSLVLVAVIALGTVGFAFAQAGDPPTPEAPYAPFQGYGQQGMRGARGMMGGGIGLRMSFDGEYGPLHEYMLPALAEALGMTPDELEAAHDEGITLWDIAQEKDISFEDFQALVLEAKSDAFADAVADGVITQDQADWMLSRMNGMWGQGSGPGTGTCDGTGPQGRRHGGMRNFRGPGGQ